MDNHDSSSFSAGPVNWTEIGTGVVKYLLESLASKAMDATSSGILRVAVTSGDWLNKRVTETLRRHSLVHTLLFRDQPRELSSFYVPLSLLCGDKLLASASSASLLGVSGRNIIYASGGSGKSLLMKHLYLDTASRHSHAPVFLELRRIPLRETDLVTAISNELLGKNDSSAMRTTEMAAKAGLLSLYLDGLDEVDQEMAAEFIQQITQLARRWPKCPITVSSRPDDRLSNWPQFACWQVQPLSLDQASRLIMRLRYQPQVAESFVRALEEGLFDSHRDLLANPLLLTIMLLTYADTAGIPEKRHLFYEAAFEALFTRHDAIKTGYRREKRTKLASDDFLRATSAASTQLYSRSKWSFSFSDFTESAAYAARFLHTPIGADAFLHDLMKVSCLLIRDGVEYTFVHRSFQEYFVALFIRMAPSAMRPRLLEAALKSSQSDTILEMLYDMDSHLVRRELVLPKLREAYRRIESIENCSDTMSRIAKWSGWSIVLIGPAHRPEAHIGIGVAAAESLDWRFMRFVASRVVPDIAPRPTRSVSPDKLESVLRRWHKAGETSGISQQSMLKDPDLADVVDSSWAWYSAPAGIAQLLTLIPVLEREVEQSNAAIASLFDSNPGDR